MTEELYNMGGNLSYLVQIKLWDAKYGEREAELLYESTKVRVAPLSELKHYWPELLRQAFKAAKIPLAEMCRVEGVNINSIRVTLSRNKNVGITRRRFTWKRKPYLVTIHIEREGLANVLQKLKQMVVAPGYRPIELTFWSTEKGDFASVEFDTNAGMSLVEDRFIAAHPVSDDAVVAAIADSKQPSRGRTALLYTLEPV